MAKGLRSKSKRKNRATARALIFGPVEDARLAKIVEYQQNVSPIEMVIEPIHDQVVEMVQDKHDDKKSRIERDRLFLSGNQFKRKQRAKERSKSKVRGTLRRR